MEMLLSEKYKIRQLFEKMDSKNNFLELLNFSKELSMETSSFHLKKNSWLTT